MKAYYRPTKAIIDLNAIENNLAAFQRHLPQADLIAVVKADAYGHGAVAVASRAVAFGAEFLAVATPDEALYLREQGFTVKLLVLGATPASFVPVAQEQSIALAAISLQWIQMAAAAVDPLLPDLKIHLKIDTGMRRVGVAVGEVDEALCLIRKQPFFFEGLFTHFATADEAVGQLFNQQVRQMAEIVERLDDPSVLIHVSNSAAAIMHPDLAYGAVRIGISMYGIAPSPYVEQEMPFQLEPAMSLETEIIHVKKVEAGEGISYGATYKSERDEWIATLPVGYADGMLRGLQGQEVLVRGKRVPIVGRICMDQCMIRLPEEMPLGEPVQLIGTQGEEEIRINEWAEKLDTIPYEIPCILTKRVPRMYR